MVMAKGIPRRVKAKIPRDILPIAGLMAILFSLGYMNRHNEIIAMRAGGLSSSNILAPLFLTGFILSLAVFFLNEAVLPKATLISTTVKETLLKKSGHDGKDLILSNVTLVSKTGQMIYAREYEPASQTLYEVIVTEDYPDLTLKKKIMSERAVYQDGRWTLYQARETHLDEEGRLTNKPVIVDEINLSIEEGPEEFIKQDLQTEFMSFRELSKYIQRIESAGYTISQRHLVDLYQKTADPFQCLIVFLLGAPVALRMRKGGMLANVGLALAIIVLYYGAISVSTALGKGGTIPPVISVWIPNMFFGLIGLYFIKRYF